MIMIDPLNDILGHLVATYSVPFGYLQSPLSDQFVVVEVAVVVVGAVVVGNVVVVVVFLVVVVVVVVVDVVVVVVVVVVEVVVVDSLQRFCLGPSVCCLLFSKYSTTSFQ